MHHIRYKSLLFFKKLRQLFNFLMQKSFKELSATKVRKHKKTVKTQLLQQPFKFFSASAKRKRLHLRRQSCRLQSKMPKSNSIPRRWQTAATNVRCCRAARLTGHFGEKNMSRKRVAVKILSTVACGLYSLRHTPPMQVTRTTGDRWSSCVEVCRSTTIQSMHSWGDNEVCNRPRSLCLYNIARIKGSGSKFLSKQGWTQMECR